MRLPVDYFFGNQNMADAQGSAQLERDTGLTDETKACVCHGMEMGQTSS